MTRASVRDVLLRRDGLVFVEPGGGPPAGGALVRGALLELAHLGYVASARLEARLAQLGEGALARVLADVLRVLREVRGVDVTHAPLFRAFPEGVPADTEALWWQKVLVHYLQQGDQPCLFCRRTGTTHVLSPCAHVVCDRCFDGASYAACPVCEHAVDRGSPFFRAAPVRVAGAERVRFTLVDLGNDVEAAARALFTSFCARTQPMSPADVTDLVAIVEERGPQVLAWLPARIAVKENVAHVFGTLFKLCAPAVVLPVARAHLRTATDVLRLVAVYSGASAALQGETQWRPLTLVNGAVPAWARVERILAPWRAAQASTPWARSRLARDLKVPVVVHRFEVAKLGRPLRRALLALLDGLEPDVLVEDMLRHRAYWVWLGELLHPGEHAARFPTMARAFAVVRGRAPDGTPAPRVQTFAGRVEAAAAAHDAVAMIDVLRARPGELARRLDHALRVAGDDAHARTAVIDAFAGATGAMATPVLLTLRSHVIARRTPGRERVFFPKGDVARGAVAPDRRPALPADAVAPIERAITAELLRRCAAQPAFADAIVDVDLHDVPVPFNERTAARAAVALPRGASIALPEGKLLRLFLHWCQPEGGEATDLDLSVFFADDAWNPVGVCSYYQLAWEDAQAGRIATSAGDRRDAPWPDGVSELVDVDLSLAQRVGARYAVMVVNAYAGLSFSRLARAFAGVMLRDDAAGLHVDPRTVELRFELAGDNGTFAPLVIDLDERRLHWLDVHARGQLAMNNVETAKGDLARICPRMIDLFASGQRPSMLDLALLHAAARCERVWLRRGDEVRRYARRADEDVAAFHARLRRGEADDTVRSIDAALAHGPVLAALLHGDVELPAGSQAYALFRERVTAPIAAAELLVAAL